MKKRIAIFSIILIVISLILISLWMVSRQTAEKRGVEPMSFREFITGQTKSSSEQQNPDGVLTSDFVNPDTGDNTSSPNNQINSGSTAVVPGTQSSTFTQSNPISVPTNTTQSGSGTSSGGTLSGSNSTTTQVSPNQTITTDSNPVPAPSGPQTPVCSQSDTQITFTPAEIARLRELERRFYATAEYLHTDEELAIETSNYDTFKLKSDKILEMYNYCQQKSPLLPDPLLQKRVATPFWVDNQPNNSFIENAIFLDIQQGVNMPLTTNGGVEILKRRLEPMFRINLW